MIGVVCVRVSFVRCLLVLVGCSSNVFDYCWLIVLCRSSFVVVGWLLVVGCLRVVRVLMVVVCSDVLFVVQCDYVIVRDVCYVLCDVCCSSFVVCRVLFVGCRVLLFVG